MVISSKPKQSHPLIPHSLSLPLSMSPSISLTPKSSNALSRSFPRSLCIRLTAYWQGPFFPLCLSYNLKLISHYLRWILTHTISNLSRPWWLLAEAEALYADARLYTYTQCQLLHTRLALFYYRRQQICMPSTVNLCANVFFFSPPTLAEVVVRRLKAFLHPSDNVQVQIRNYF